MRFKRALAIFAFFTSFSASAIVLVQPPLPYTQNVSGTTGYTIYYGGSFNGGAFTGGADTAAFFNPNAFRTINTSDSGQIDARNWIWLDVSSTQQFPANSIVVATISTGTSSGSEVPLKAASAVGMNAPSTTVPILCNTNGLSCQGNNGAFLSALYGAPQTVLRMAFSLTDLCATSGATGSLCTNSAYRDLSGQNLSQTLTVTVGVVGNNSQTGPVGTTPIASTTAVPVPAGAPDTAKFTLTISDIAPVLQCPKQTDITQWYFPGDQQVYIKTQNFVVGAGVGNDLGNGTPDSGVPANSLLVYANDNAAPATGSSALTQASTTQINRNISSNLANASFSGMQNTDSSGNSNRYQMAIAAQNLAGVVSGPFCIPLDVVQAQTIGGVLTQSKCFIATAAFQDGRAAPVMMLRKFRDTVLSRSDFGKAFIKTYYRYSPALAEWAWDKPIIRSFALRLLAPVELMAWAILKFSSAEESYTEMLKKKLQAQDAEKKKEPETGSYSEKLRKEVLEKDKEDATPVESGSYTDEEKKKLAEPETKPGYADGEKKKLPPEKHPESPIETVKAGKDRIPKPDRPDIQNAFQFEIGIAPGVQVTNSGGTHTFSQVYGSSWNPDFGLHFERQLFHSENFGSFGLSFNTGLCYASGYGQLAKSFSGSTQSQTQFNFFQVPLMIGGNYRFNLLRLLRPYVGASAGPMMYWETRKDDRPGFRGYTFVWEMNLGAALLLDFFDSKTALDSYMGEGIQHAYLVAEYKFMNTFSGPVVFERNGIYSGFLFEF